MLLDKNKLVAFAEHNKNLIFADFKEVSANLRIKHIHYETQDYGINEENFLAWIDSHKQYQAYYNNDMYILANFFRAFTEYVSIEQFISKIFQLCASVRALSLDYKKIILYSGKKSHNKSNFWLLLLYVYILKDTITDVYVTEDPNVEFKNLCNSQKTLIIFPDDASYSGQQIKDQVLPLRNLKINSDIYIAVPYISEKAIESIKGAYQTEEKTGCIMIPRETYIFYTFGENIIKKGRGDLVNKYKNKVEFDKPTIYFAHKLADTTSIPQNIYIFGVQLNHSKDKSNNLRKYFNTSLIKNCTYTDFNHEMLSTLTDDANNDLGMAMCPLPFYKYITYYRPNGDRFNDLGYDQIIQIDNEPSFQV